MKTRHLHILQTPTRTIRASHGVADGQEILYLEPSQTGYGFGDEKIIAAWVKEILEGSQIEVMMASSSDQVFEI